MSRPVKSQEGYVKASAIWLIACLLGTVPFLVSGTSDNFIDAFFESCSGFSTTGATVIEDLESVPKAVLFWRCFSQWLGGLGIVVLITALIPAWGINGQITAYAETPGVQKGKNTAKFSETSVFLYIMYIGFTLLLTLLLIISGMTVFDSVTTAFSTMATGGFSNYNNSAAGFGNASKIIIAVFMILAGVNFNLYYKFFKRKSFKCFKDEELRFYAMVLLASFALVFLGLVFQGGEPFSFNTAVDSAFQVSSILTTTGLTTCDYTLWPSLCCMVLFLLFFFGGCSGSTAGGIKISRVLICIKMIHRSFDLKVHPNRIVRITLNKNELSVDVIIRSTGFIMMYVLTAFIGTLLISLNNVDFMTSFSAALSCIGNVGPGFGLIGPAFNFASLNDFSKFVCSILMILGRLELYTVYILFSRFYWNHNLS